MNLILLFDSDFISPNRVHLSGRRFTHIQDILKAECSQILSVGKINGLMGQGTLVSKKTEQNLSFPRKRESIYLELDVKLDTKPPEALALTLILALPRPPMLKRILFSSAQLGIKKIIILNFNRVEKSFWNSSSLKPQAITEQLVLGLEQAKDTVMPEVILKKRFKPFVQDELPALIKGKLALVAHPIEKIFKSDQGPVTSDQNRTQSPIWKKNSPCSWFHVPGSFKELILVIGPEGGIIDYEIELLKAAGCRPIDLGPRILRTETVLPYIVGRLF